MIFSNVTFRCDGRLIPLQSINSMYSILKYLSLSLSVCAYVQEKRTRTHGVRGCLLAKDGYIACFYNKKQETQYFISASKKKLNTRLRIVMSPSQISFYENQRATPVLFCDFFEIHKHFKHLTQMSQSESRPAIIFAAVTRFIFSLVT